MIGISIEILMKVFPKPKKRNRTPELMRKGSSHPVKTKYKRKPKHGNKEQD